jgi:hypothetical protein
MSLLKTLMSLLKTLNLLLEVVDGSSEFGAKLLNLLIYFDEDREKVARLMKLHWNLYLEMSKRRKENER